MIQSIVYLQYHISCYGFSDLGFYFRPRPDGTRIRCHRLGCSGVYGYSIICKWQLAVNYSR